MEVPLSHSSTVLHKRATSRRIFRRVAHHYDTFKAVLSCSREIPWKRAAFATLVGAGPYERHLDLATGTGDLLDIPTGASITVGLDLDGTMLRRNQARNRDNAVEFVWADLNEPPFSNGSFDLITMGYGLRYAPDPVELLRKCMQMLRPRGMLFVFDVAQPKSTVLWYCYLGYLWSMGTVLGTLLHLRPDAYWHLPHSLVQFVAHGPVPDQLASAGFRSIRSLTIAGGVLAAYAALPSDAPNAA